MAIGLYRKSFKLAELQELIRRLTKIAEEKGGEIILKNPLYLHFVEVGDAFTKALDLTHSTEMGEKIKALDLKRDNLYTQIYSVIKAYEELDVSDLTEAHPQQMAARFLRPFFDKKGSIHQLSYAEETTALRSLFESLNHAEAQNALKTLSLDGVYDALVKCQAAFEACIDQKNKKVVLLHQQQSATSLKKALIQAVNDFCRYIESLAKMDEKWLGFYREIEVAIANI